MVMITFLLDYIELIRRGGSRCRRHGLLFEMAALKLPHTAQEVLPFAILFGTMLAFWRLTRNNELVVARAAGVSVWQFLTPAVLVALLAGIIAVTIFNPIASLTEASYEKLESHVLRQGSDQLPVECRVMAPAKRSARQPDHHPRRENCLAATDPRPVILFFFNIRPQFTSRIEARRRGSKAGMADRERHPLAAQPACRAVRRNTAGHHPDAAQDRGELRLARTRCRFGLCPGSSPYSNSRGFRRSAIASISTCCSPVRFYCARWSWWPRPQFAYAAARRREHLDDCRRRRQRLHLVFRLRRRVRARAFHQDAGHGWPRGRRPE